MIKPFVIKFTCTIILSRYVTSSAMYTVAFSGSPPIPMLSAIAFIDSGGKQLLTFAAFGSGFSFFIWLSILLRTVNQATFNLRAVNNKDRKVYQKNNWLSWALPRHLNQLFICTYWINPAANQKTVFIVTQIHNMTHPYQLWWSGVLRNTVSFQHKQFA